MVGISEFYEGKTILVTGATGFLGKAVTEKILRSLPQVKKIILLVRGKALPNGGWLSAQERVEKEIFRSSLLTTLRRRYQDGFARLVADKVQVVEGELSHERLGLDAQSFRQLAKETDLIINSAAVVAFDERLDRALDLNVLAIRRILELARERIKGDYTLDVAPPLLVHISTCYVCGIRSGIIKEELPDPSGVGDQIDQILQMCRDIEASTADDETPPVIRETAFKERAVEEGMRLSRSFGFNDTYTFTKWLGERLLIAERGQVPALILRPSIIESTLKEPEGGWIESQRMADPLIIGFAKGLLKDFPGDPDSVVDIIPCDLVVNAVLTLTAHFGNRVLSGALPASSACEVYQIATSTVNLLTLRDMVRFCSQYFMEKPLIDRDGRPIRVRPWTLPSRDQYRQQLEKSRRNLQRLEKALKLVSFFPPARRALQKLSTKRAGLNRLEHYVNIYAPYTHFYAKFSVEKTLSVWSQMDKKEREQFPFDPESIDWQTYLQKVHVPGLQRHILGIAAVGGDEGAIEILPDLLSRAAARFPDKIALQTRRDGKWIRWTYGQWHRKAQSIGHRLRLLGVEPRDRVLLWAPNGPEWGIGYFGASFAGATVVPVDWQWSEQEVAEIAAITKAKKALCDESRWRQLRIAVERTSADTQVLSLQSLLLDEKEPPRKGRILEPGTTGDDVASIIFVTGPTVEAKGACLTHSNFLSNLRAIVSVLPPMQNDQFLSLLPLHHALEFTGGLLVPMWAGAAVTYPETLRSRAVQELMREVGTTVVIGVPRIFQIFHEAIHNEVKKRGWLAVKAVGVLKGISKLVLRLTGRNVGRTLFRSVHQRFGGRIRAFISGGAALPGAIFDDFQAMGFLICEGYGLTETSPVVTVNPMEAPKRGSVGKPLPGVDVVINNATDDGVGEILVRGPNVFLGYYANPEATDRVLRDGWLYTGDLGKMDRDGYLYITGRIKDVIITGAGKNVYPDEVEARLAGLPGVAEWCVVGLWDEETMGERVHLVVRPDREVVALPDDEWESRLRQEVRRRSAHWPSYQRIAQIHIWEEELPKGIALAPDRAQIKGKLLAKLKRAVGRETALAEGGISSPFPPDLMKQMSALIARITGKPERPLSPGTVLEELGLDSLLRLELLIGLESQFNVSLPESSVVQARTVGDIAEVLLERLGAPRQPVVSYDGASRPDIRSRLQSLDPHELNPWLHQGFLQRLLRWGARKFLSSLYQRFFQLEVKGLDNVPDQGAFIIAANHSSHLDTGAILVALEQRAPSLFVLGAEDYFFNNRLKGWFFTTFLRVVPFSRYASPLESLRLATGILRAGYPVLIYPEGTRSVTGKLQPFKPGLALLAVETGVPIVPARIEGTFEALPKGRWLPKRAQVTVTFAQPVPPLTPQTDEDRQRLYKMLTETVRQRIDCPA
ncbi:MAG: AMP-binding protein [Armatimonadetes bacterium]|nr:AMP-binding protein [Armatimonadota bacterium]MDW8120859.1 AMP-binding protein [Armatimonadota bacterium]